MTPQEAITQISHAIASGKLEDAEKALEEYAKEKHFAFKKWVSSLFVNDTYHQYKNFTDNQLWGIFTNQIK